MLLYCITRYCKLLRYAITVQLNLHVVQLSTKAGFGQLSRKHCKKVTLLPSSYREIDTEREQNLSVLVEN